MPFSYEQKVQAVNMVLNEHLSYLKAGRAISASKNAVMGWVKRVEEHGFECLKAVGKRTHSGEFKVNVVEYMHNNRLSAYAVAAYFNLAKVQVERWERIYYEEGAETLLTERRGRLGNNHMPKKKKTPNEDLIAEVQRLRMENEYLKKLNALVRRRMLQRLTKK